MIRMQTRNMWSGGVEENSIGRVAALKLQTDREKAGRLPVGWSLTLEDGEYYLDVVHAKRGREFDGTWHSHIIVEDSIENDTMSFGN